MDRDGAWYSEPHPPNLTPQSSSPFIRRFSQFTTSPELHTSSCKRMKTFSDGNDTYGMHVESKYNRGKSLPDVLDYSDPSSISNLMEELDRGIYGSVTKDVEDICSLWKEVMNPLYSLYPSLSRRRLDFTPQSPRSGLHTHDPLNDQGKEVSPQEVIDLDGDCAVTDSLAVEDSKPVCKSSTDLEMPKVDNLQNHNDRQIVILDSDDEEENAELSGTNQASRCSLEALKFEAPQASHQQNPYNQGESRSLLTHLDTTVHEVRDNQYGTVSRKVLDASEKAYLHYQGVLLKKPIDDNPVTYNAVMDDRESEVVIQDAKALNAEIELKKDKGVYIGVQDDVVKSNSASQSDFDDGLGDIWREMTLALECNKDAAGEPMEHSEDEQEEECDHSFLLKDDLGYVCRVCGVIKKSIETIFDFQWVKASRTSRMHMSESRSMKERDEDDIAPFSGPSGSHDLAVVEISVHPRYMKLMKPHQLEGFNFLVRNLISDDPGGCILAHAPGSGKTFMIISFIQSFLAKFPEARPLVVLPKGILGTWKKEFLKWQVEDIPLYDFYSSKAEGRTEQLVILKEWVEQKGILFLGYKQFANIVCKSESNAAAACQDILLRVPSILICDEGHTPRNQDTDILHSLKKVHTPRKVVLSGTLFQNHVKEVFNILNLVRPNFLKSDVSKTIRRRVMSRGKIGRKLIKAGADAAFYEVVEDTLQNDENSKRKIAVIQDLREMTRNVLHYYKGDFLDELPGLVDFTVLLNLSPKQKQIVEKLRKLEKFKRTSIGTAVYLHPLLKEFSEESEKGCNFNEAKMNDLINKMDFRDGVKTKFFLNVLRLCESSGEKVLVFSQYLLPLKFLERLVVKTKGWSPGKEIFMINGDTSPEDREWSMERFNNSSDAKVFFGSIKACGEGISLVGASRILILDVHLNPSVTRQAIGRAFRPGQVRKVYAYRLVAADSPEEDSHDTSCRKDLISKMWFEWSEYCGYSNFEMESINVEDTDDTFWESPSLREDVNEVKKR